MFWKKLEKKNKELRRRLAQLADKRAKIRDMVARISTGILTGTPTGSSEDLLERLRGLTVQRENLELQARIARAEAEIKAESLRLEQEITRVKQQLQEPLTLCLLTPTASQQMKRGATLNIQWSSTGPIGARLRIGFLKRGVLLRNISFGAPTDVGTFSWQIPIDLPPADDYQISIQDPTSGCSDVSDNFQIS